MCITYLRQLRWHIRRIYNADQCWTLERTSTWQECLVHSDRDTSLTMCHQRALYEHGSLTNSVIISSSLAQSWTWVTFLKTNPTQHSSFGPDPTQVWLSLSLTLSTRTSDLTKESTIVRDRSVFIVLYCIVLTAASTQPNTSARQRHPARLEIKTSNDQADT